MDHSTMNHSTMDHSSFLSSSSSSIMKDSVSDSFCVGDMGMVMYVRQNVTSFVPWKTMAKPPIDRKRQNTLRTFFHFISVLV